MDKETLQLMWCEFITAMAEDNNECHSTMKGMLDGGFDLAIVQLCGMTPTDLYHQVLARQENAS
jgi:hypothetical protein